MPVFLSMACAVLIWASYPYAAVLALNNMTGLELIFITTVISSFCISLVSFLYFVKRRKLRTVIMNHKKLPRSAWFAILISGITHLVCNGFFFLALSMSHKAGVSLVYESWPIIAVIATPFFIRRQWKEVGLTEFIMSLVALGGVIVVVLSNQQIQLPAITSNNLSIETDYIGLLGYVLAFLGGYACALNAIFKAVTAENFRQLHHKDGAIIMSEFYSRVIALIIAILLLPFYSEHINLSEVNWIPSFYIGFIVLLMGGFFYTYALINTDRPTIHILYYFVPLIAVFILWFFGESDVNPGLLIGGGMIIAANIYLYFSGRKATYMDTPSLPPR